MFIFFQRDISEMHQPLSATFCTVIRPRPNFIMPVQKFTEFIEATRITGGLSEHRQKSYNAYYPNN